MDIKQFCVELVFIILVVFIVQTLVAGEIYDDDEDESGNWNRCPWIRNKLKNGRVKIRSRGRIAKFLCEPGYELAGKRFATCVRGQWNNPLPVCVSRGCNRPRHVDNARVTMTYRGAVLTYDCQPGYTLNGGASIYCDGRRWSDDPPKCEVSTTDPQTTCDFEDPDLCGWTQDPTHDFDWKRNQFATPSGHAGTGPSFDHTFGEGKGGFYLFMEASSPRSVNDTARLFSPVYSQDYSGGCFIFWYHMFGSTTGGLRVYVKPESHVFGELGPMWMLYGDQGNHWFRGNITLPHLAENFQIVIEGIRGSSYIGDTAIDDVSLNDGDCESVGNATDNTSETLSDSCRGRCRESSNSSACGCNDDCVALSTCCDDFESICTKNSETETDETKNENSGDHVTLAITHGTTETEVPVSTKPVTSSITETLAPPLITGTTKFQTETTSVPVHENSSFVTQPTIISTTISTKKPSSPSITSTTSTSTTASTAVTTTTSTPSTTTSIPSTTTATTTITLPSTATSSSTPSTTTTIATKPPTTIATKQSTTITTTIKPSTTTTTTPTTTTKATSTAPTTTTLKTSSSTAVSTTSTTARFPSIIVIPKTTTTRVITTSILQTSTTEEPSTRRIYNLRPRNRTTVSTYITTTSTITPQSSVITNDPVRTTPKTYVKSFQPPTTMSSQAEVTSFHPPIITTTKSSNVPVNSQAIPQEKATEKSVVESEAHVSVSNAGSSVVTIVSVIIVILICSIVGALYFVRRWKAQKLSKLNDDSEMKFLSENEHVEYSDSSALDRINFNP